MATKRKTVTVTDEDGGLDINASEWLSGVADDGIRVRFSRQCEDGMWELVDMRAREAVTDEFLMKLKPGTYRLKVLKQNGTIIAGRTIRIGENPMNTLPIVQENNSDGFSEKLFLLMQSQNTQALQMWQQMNAQTMQMFTQSQNSMATVLAAALSNKGGSVTELVQGLAGLKQLEPKGDELDKVAKIIEIADKLGGNGSAPKDTATVLLEMAKDVVPALLASRALPPPLPAPGSDHHEATPVNRSMDTPRHPGVEAPTASAPTVRAGEAGTGSQPEYQLQLKVRDFWSKLHTAAQRNEDPDELAAAIGDLAELLDDEAAEVLLVSIEKSESFEAWKKMIAVAPSVEAWFGRFFTAVKLGYMKEETSAPANVPEIENLGKGATAK